MTKHASQVRWVWRHLGAAAMVLVAAQSAQGAQYFAALNGTAGGDGSIASPWDLQTALSHPAAVHPGDTIWVRGGRYTGPFTSLLKGAAGAAIIVRNYQRERVVLEASGWECNPLIPGHRCNAFVDPCSCNPSLHSGCPNNRPTPLTVASCSHHVWFWGIETVNNDPSRYNEPPGGCSNAPECCYPNGDFSQPLVPECDQTPAAYALSSHAGIDAIFIEGDDIKLINSILHDGGVGVSWFEPAEGNSEVYGSWIFSNGWVNPLRGHGHGFYAQNAQTSESRNTKTIRHTITWNNFGWGIHARGGCGQVEGFTYDGNVAFGNGQPKNAFFSLDPVLYVDTQKSNFPNYFVEAASSMRDIAVRNNFSYSPLSSSHYGNALRAGSSNHFHADIDVKDNYFVGDGTPLFLENWTMARVTGNTFVGGQDNNAGTATEALVRYVDERSTAHLGSYIWDNNSYFNNGGSTTPFLVSSGIGGSFYSFEGWKALSGLDASSTYAAGVPSTNHVAVLPNDYESGRAHIVIYNWQDLASVPIDLSTAGLTHGQAFKIHNVQSFRTEDHADYLGNVVASGTFDSGVPVVNVAMNDLTVTQPIGFLASQTAVFGNTAPIPPTKPESWTNLLFAVYLLMGE